MTMASAVLLLTLAAVPAQPSGRARVVVLDVKAVQGVPAGTATILTSIIAGDTQRAGFDVVSQADIATLIGFERQRRMLGCGDDSSCLAEIGGALGAEFVLSTQVGQIGSRFHLALQVLDARRARVLSRVSTFSDRTEDGLAETAQRAVAEALDSARQRGSRNATSTPTPTPTPTPTSTSTSTPTSTSTSTSTSTPTSTPTSTSTSTPTPTSTSTSTSTFYVEGRVAFGNVTLSAFPEAAAADSPWHKPGFGLRGGYRAWPELALELGVSYANLVHAEGAGQYSRPTCTAPNFCWQDTSAEATAAQLTAGAAWAPHGTRYFAVAAEAGVARVHLAHSVMALQARGIAEAISAATVWSPTASAELRADLPLAWLTVGVRAGASFTRLPEERQEANGRVPWVRSGWLRTLHGALAVRREF